MRLGGKATQSLYCFARFLDMPVQSCLFRIKAQRVQPQRLVQGQKQEQGQRQRQEQERDGDSRRNGKRGGNG